jgi:hypothetical protein
MAINLINRKFWVGYTLGLICILILSLFLSVSANASLLPDDTEHAMPNWFGTKTFNFHEEAQGVDVNGSIDYAVYDKGQFNLSFPGQDPSDGTQYVYRFQLFNNSVTSGDFLKKLTIGLMNIQNVSNWNCTWIEPDTGGYTSGDIAPKSSQVGFVGTTSVNWGFSASTLQPGLSSKMLIFTSPNPPTLASATLNSRATSSHFIENGIEYNWWEGQLPSPVPEPSTICGLMMAGMLLLGVRLYRG